MEAFDMTFNI